MASLSSMSRKSVTPFFLALLIFGLAACSNSKPADSGDDGGTAEACRDTFLDVGEIAPELTLTDVTGQKSRVQALTEGKVALVDFWATWCAPCIAAMPHLDDLYKKHRDRGLVVVGIMADGNASSIAAEYLPSLSVSYPMLIDDDSERSACVWGPLIGYPTVLLLDRDGRVAGSWFGTGDVTKIEKAVDELVAASGDGSASAAPPQ